MITSYTSTFMWKLPNMYPENICKEFCMVDEDQGTKNLTCSDDIAASLTQAPMSPLRSIV